ncbi:MAG TPA: ATP-binding protein [Solirubrobacteraceae bacterium]|nr:ATP-binding protein [Solirubrobacteraceae bacterium]
MHDLIMQDLSYALASARALEDDPALASRITAIVASAERALAGAREVLGDLSARERKPLADVFAESVRAAARDTPLTFQLPSTNGDQPDAATIDALVHIGREAVTNAVKHGHAHEILVVLEHDEEWRLLVTDRGSGFDTAARQGTSVVSDANGTGDFKGPDGANGRDGGFGLESMRRHAQALGGRLSVRSSPGEGTTVEAVLP